MNTTATHQTQRCDDPDHQKRTTGDIPQADALPHPTPADVETPPSNAAPTALEQLLAAAKADATEEQERLRIDALVNKTTGQLTTHMPCNVARQMPPWYTAKPVQPPQPHPHTPRPPVAPITDPRQPARRPVEKGILISNCTVSNARPVYRFYEAVNIHWRHHDHIFPTVAFFSRYMFVNVHNDYRHWFGSIFPGYIEYPMGHNLTVRVKIETEDKLPAYLDQLATQGHDIQRLKDAIRGPMNCNAVICMTV